MAHIYTAAAHLEGSWWVVRVPELDAVTQARSKSDIDRMATGLVAALVDVDEDLVRVDVSVIET